MKYLERIKEAMELIELSHDEIVTTVSEYAYVDFQEVLDGVRVASVGECIAISRMAGVEYAWLVGTEINLDNVQWTACRVEES